MSPLWLALGWIGQGLFFTRFLVQWWASEREGRSVAPLAFWWCSLIGTFLVGGYTVARGEAVLLPVFCINVAVYLRNLLLYGDRGRQFRLHPLLAAAAGLAAAGALWAAGAFEPRRDLGDAPLWTAVGVIGTAVWSARFLLQWWISERRGQSQFPASFWWVSLAGNALLLAYAAHLADPLYLAGFAIGPFVQVRNLVLIARERRAVLAPAGARAQSSDPAPSPSAPAVRSTNAATVSSRNSSTP